MSVADARRRCRAWGGGGAMGLEVFQAFILDLFCPKPSPFDLVVFRCFFSSMFGHGFFRFALISDSFGQVRGFSVSSDFYRQVPFSQALAFLLSPSGQLDLGSKWNRSLNGGDVPSNGGLECPAPRHWTPPQILTQPGVLLTSKVRGSVVGALKLR